MEQSNCEVTRFIRLFIERHHKIGVFIINLECTHVRRSNRTIQANVFKFLELENNFQVIMLTTLQVHHFDLEQFCQTFDYGHNFIEQYLAQLFDYTLDMLIILN